MRRSVALFLLTFAWVCIGSTVAASAAASPVDRLAVVAAGTEPPRHALPFNWKAVPSENNASCIETARRVADDGLLGSFGDNHPAARNCRTELLAAEKAGTAPPSQPWTPRDPEEDTPGAPRAP